MAGVSDQIAAHAVNNTASIINHGMAYFHNYPISAINQCSSFCRCSHAIEKGSKEQYTLLLWYAVLSFIIVVFVTKIVIITMHVIVVK